MIDVKLVKGVGPKSLMLLQKLDIKTVDDLVTHYPYRYDLIKRTDLRNYNEQEKCIVDGRVDCIPILIRLKNNLNKMNIRLITSDCMIVGVSIFNRAYLKKDLEVGKEIIVIGKYEKEKNTIIATEIRMGLLPRGEKIEAVYHSTTSLNSKNLSVFINQALLQYGNKIDDYIPDYITCKYNFLNKKTALNIVHNPPSYEKLKEALVRLKYEELFSFMTKINYVKLKYKTKQSGTVKDINYKALDNFIAKLPFKLTEDQNKVLFEILNDLSSPYRMNRLLQGDVGSGKTIIAILAMYATYLSGYTSALMAPTEILANQHYENISKLFRNTNIKVGLLTGSMKKKEKDDIHKMLEEGNIDIIIGTHALIQEGVNYKNLGLVITDEQHRFGVLQRTSLQNKGEYPDILYMSATPIPRTYALTIYGDMDISTIKTLPSGRKKIKTYLKTTKEMKDILKMMYDELKENHQIYVIAPLIEESETTDLTTVTELKDKMDLAFGSQYNIDIIHGKLHQQDKDKIMERFVSNKTQILISTTVIEVGVDVPNTTMIVIFDANRFGLSTLHQLRGRVGRNDMQSTCILISDSDTARLDVMTKTNDGFEISEEDFKLRGHGDLFGVKQSGDMTFKIANIKEDYKILLQAKKDSLEFLNNKDEKYDELKKKIINTIKEG